MRHVPHPCLPVYYALINCRGEIFYFYKGTSKNQIRMVPLGTFKVKIRFFHYHYNEKSNF